MLQAGNGTKFALIVWWDRLTGAAVFKNILKTCTENCQSLDGKKRDINRIYKSKQSHSPTIHSVTPVNSLPREGIFCKVDPLENTTDNTIMGGKKHLVLSFTTDTCIPEFKNV